MVPFRLQSLLIGPGGHIIKDIMKKFGDLSIDFPTHEEKSDKIVCV